MVLKACYIHRLCAFDAKNILMTRLVPSRFWATFPKCECIDLNKDYNSYF